MSLFKLSIAVALTAIFVVYVPTMFEPNLPPIVEGNFQPEFMEVAETLRKNMESGKEMGAAFAVYYDGEPIIDMWAGYADREAQRRWRNETMTLAFSVTKSLMGVLIGIMVDRGIARYDDPVIDYWPTFGRKNKENITLEMFLSHQAGLPALDKQINLRDLKTNPTMVEKILEAQETAWPAGQKHGYHIYTYGLYLDRLIKKIDPEGRDTAKIFQEEIAKPFDIDFYMKLPRRQNYRTARLYKFTSLRTVWDLISNPRYFKLLLDLQNNLTKQSTEVFRELANCPLCFNNHELREITMSSSMGTGTARGLAKLFSILASGGKHKGKQLLSPEVIQQLSTQLTSGECQIFPSIDAHWGRGVPILKNPFGGKCFGGVGYGGQIVIADPANKLGIAYLTNYMSIYSRADDPRFLDLQSALYKTLDRYLSRIEKS